MCVVTESAESAGSVGPAACEDIRAGVHDDLGWVLTTLLRGYGRRADEALADLPGGPRGYRLLAAAVRDCPRSQLALAQQIGLDRTVVTYLIDDLERARLLERQPDPADRRTRRIVATAAGKRRLAAMDAALAAVELELLGGLDEAERGQLRALLGRVAGRLADGDAELRAGGACPGPVVPVADACDPAADLAR